MPRPHRGLARAADDEPSHAVAEHDELADADGMALDQPLEEVGQRLAVLRDVQAGVVPHIERSECEVLLEE